MSDNIITIPANANEINFYTSLGEALLKTQVVEQALSHSICLKMHPDEKKERADELLKQKQRYTLGKAIKIASEQNLFTTSLKDELEAFLEQRNWLVHKVICGNEEDFNMGVITTDLLNKIHSIADKAMTIQRAIEYDMIDFCTSKGRDMSKQKALLKLQEQGVRIRMKY